ncbi:MAG TPA: alpha/beta hydrolase-fold protein [Acidimicrobiia bacterium]
MTNEMLPSALTELLEQANGPFHFQGDTYVVFRGQADRVEFVTWMPGFPPPPEFQRLGADLFYLRLPLPGTARIEYRLRVIQGRRRSEIDDPLNPPSTSNPFGENSVLAGPDYVQPWYAGNGFAGELTEIRVRSTQLGGRRHHHVYAPAGQSGAQAAALLLVHDGSDFLKHGGLGFALDRLVEAEVLPRLKAVLLDPWNRLTEYGASPQHSAHVVEEVLPHLNRRLRIRTDRQTTVAVGSSLGALASLALAYHYPSAVGGLASLSGSYFHQADNELPPPALHPILDFLTRLDPKVLQKSTVYQSVGRYEGLVDGNRRLRPILSAAGVKLRTVETWTGHDWEAWRDRLEDALRFLLPPPAPLN